MRKFRVAAMLLVLVPAARAFAQTDYYNTSSGRPLRVEDAVPVEYRAIELDIAPLRLERARGGTYRWSLHPEATAGIFPRTQLRIGVPVHYADLGPRESVGGITGIELSGLYALNTETRTMPALGVSADVLLPAGSLARDAVYATVTGLVTRTFPWARVHANAEVTVGPGAISTTDVLESGKAAADASRWLAGIAVDRTVPLRALLIAAEAFAEQPLASEERVAWNVAAGVRYQLTPRASLDAGVGRRLTGDDRAWYTTIGSAFSLGFR